jgi:translocation and assembly module TamB
MEKATGLNCRIARVALNVFRGRFEIGGLELTPQTPAPGLAACSVDEIRASLSISSFWHFRIRLDELNIVRPRVELISGGGESSWNPEEALKTLKLSLRLEAAKVTVQEGLFKVNNQPAPFHLSLEDLDCEVRYAKRLPSYKIHLKYKQGRVFYERRDIVHDLEADADLSLQGVEIESFKFRHGESLLHGSGSVRNWNSPVLLIRADGEVSAKDLILADASLYEGRGGVNVHADFRHDKDGIYSKGSFSSRTGGYRKMTYSDLAGDYEIRRDVLYLRKVSGRIAKGSFLVNGEIQLREANKTPHRVTITAKDVPIIEGARLLNLPLMNFENTTDSTTTLVWRHGDRDLRADCEATLHGLARAESKSAKAMLLDGKVQFTYFGGGEVHISSASLSSPYTSVQASGGRGAQFRVQLSTTRMAEPLGLIAGFSPAIADLLEREPDLFSMAGTYDFDGDVRIKSSADVEYQGSLSIKNGQWRSYKIDTLSTRAHFSSPRLELRSMEIHRGRQAVEGELDLELAEGERISGLRFGGVVRNISLDSLKDFGADTSQMAGICDGSGWIRYSMGAWEGEGQVAVEKGNYKGESFDSLQAQVRIENQQLRLIRAEAARGSARISGEGQIDLNTRQLNVTIRLQGFPLEEIPAVQARNLPIQGRVRASGVLRGTTQNPAFAGEFEMDALRYDSWNLGRGKGRLEFENATVHGNASIQSEFGNLAIRADISSGAGFPGKAILEFDNLDVQKIIPGKTPSYLEELSTALKGKIEIDGKFNELDSLKMRGEVDGARFKIHDYELQNAGRIQFSILNRNLRAESVHFVGEGTSLILSGTVPLDDSPNLDLNLSGNLNLLFLEGMERNLHSAGTAAINIRASGLKGNPQIIGRVSLQDARLEHQDLPFRLSAMQGDIVFSRNLIRFEKVRGNAASGTLELSGIIEHQNAVLRSVNLGISIRNARLLYPKDFRSIVNAELALSGNNDFRVLSGEVVVARSEYVRSFNLLEQLASRSVTQSGPLTTEPYLMGLRLNVEIRSDNGLVIDNELTKLRGSLRLTLRGTPAYPSLTGRVEAGEGTIYFRGNRFEILHATADFVGGNRINPILEIRAEADVKTYRLILDAVGDLDHLNLNVTSDPPMSTVDILSLLTTGKAETGRDTSRRQSEMAGMSAASLLSENLTGVIGKRVQRIFGLESFRVDPFLAGVENDPTARITISERLSKDLVVTFSRNLTTNQEQIVVIEYDIGKNLSMVATRDENGKFGLDFRFRKRLR